MKNYSHHYTESGFWALVQRVSRQISFIRDLLALYFCFKDGGTPVWVKAIIVAALGYFIAPMDAIPDTIPAIGWTDDGGVIITSLSTVRSFVHNEHWKAADIALGKFITPVERRTSFWSRIGKRP
jgi:uncharacterized membrane protein YkvA (DUF1232 family)